MPKTPSEVVPGSPAHTGHWQSWCNPAVTGILVSPPRLGRAGQSPIPSTVLCLIPRCGRRALHGPRREREVALGEGFDIPADYSVDEDLQRRLDYQNVIKILSAFPERERELVALKYGAELTNREIASITRLSESNVGTILHRVLGRIRNEWEQDRE